MEKFDAVDIIIAKRDGNSLTDEQIDRFGFKSTPPPYDRYLEQEDYKVMVGLLERFL